MATFEVVSLLVNAGVAPDKAVDILQKSSGRNYATEITLPDNILSGKMHQGFSMTLMQKDAGLALAMAATRQQAMPLGDTALNALQTAIDAYGMDADMSLVAYLMKTQRVRVSGPKQRNAPRFANQLM